MNTGSGQGKKVAGIAVLCVAWIVSLLFVSTLSESADIKVCDSQYKFTNPELHCMSEDAFGRIGNLEDDVDSYVTSVEKSGKIQRASVFFRDLVSKRWFGVHASESFAPGSLLKIPLAIAYYKYAEVQPDVLSQQFVYAPKEAESKNARQHHQPPILLERGKTYSIGELLTRMLSYSDNDAVSPLFDSIDRAFYDRVVSDFDIRIPVSGGIEQDFVNVKTYASIFRSLYNASYLNRDQSERALDVLSRSSYTSGLVAGVPSDVKIAHKFGERILQVSDSKDVLSVELHDCGIVYKKDNPYIVCVMTEGDNYQEQEAVIAEISRRIYNAL
jgi:beta-lactamase class A